MRQAANVCVSVKIVHREKAHRLQIILLIKITDKKDVVKVANLVKVKAFHNILFKYILSSGQLNNDSIIQ